MYTFVFVAGQLIGTVLWSLLGARVLMWRANKMNGWRLSFRDAFVVSIKAAFIAVAAADIAEVLLSYAGGTADLLKYVGMLIGIVAWWYVHSNALLKLAGKTSIVITIKGTRSISSSVFGVLFGTVFLISVAFVLLLVGLKSLK